jgi:hypothetical protein
MKNFDSGPYKVGQRLFLRDGVKLIPVTFVSLGPRLAKSAGKETVTADPETAIIRYKNGDLLTVALANLQPITDKKPN